ncbi:MAG: hypothetical protein ACRDRJ_45000 [Streptosporangiaceae bacterium]
MSTYRLFPSTDGPSSPVSYVGNFIAGVTFFVTSAAWFQGYWWWVCESGQSTAPVKCALWQASTGANATLVPGSVVTSGELAAGQWNWISLQAPVPLSVGAAGATAGVAQYVAAIGCNGAFPDTNNWYGPGDPYGEGITSGPLSAFSGPVGGLPSPFGIGQGLFTTAGSDPSTAPPLGGDNTYDNFWVDVQVTETAPAGTSYRLWPSYPTIPPTTNSDDFEQTMGTEFTLSEPCSLDNIWFYSPPDSTQSPTRCGIWNVATQEVVSGTDNASPSWSGPVASGWISCSCSGVTLPAGDYKVTVYTPGGSGNFYQETQEYFGANGPASAAGISYGPLSAPSTAKAAPPGQTTYQHGGWLYPDTYDTEFDGQNRWVDVEVTPSGDSSPAEPATINSSAFVSFFP